MQATATIVRSGDAGWMFPDMGFAAGAVVGIILIAAWVILASSRLVQGGTVERPERVPQLYGYTVCLVTLIWAMLATIAIIEASLTLNAPLYHNDRMYGPFEPSVTSFESFRTTYDMSRRMMGGRDPEAAKPDSIPDAELRRRYDALRAERIERNSVEARRSLILNILSLLIAAALFAFHWRWLRRIGGSAPPAGTTRIDI